MNGYVHHSLNSENFINSFIENHFKTHMVQEIQNLRLA